MKNKILSLMLLLCITLCLPVTSYAVSGKGTESNPFRITTEEELLLLADFPECCFELENNIEFTSTWESVADFSGSFDGKGHTITVSSYSSYGFFKTLTGTVENLVICSNSLNLSVGSSAAGLLAGTCSGAIKNCKVLGSATFTASYYKYSPSIDTGVGGICGELTESGTITNSVIQLDTFVVESNYRHSILAGGICSLSSGSINQCMNLNSSVQCSTYHYNDGSYSFVYYGGITYSNTGTISNCLNLESVKSSYPGYTQYAGISLHNTEGNIDCCYAACNMLSSISTKYGVADTGTMTNCYYDKVLFGASSTAYGNPKSTLAMKMEVTYKNWDFENIWAIDESEENPINGGYPYLKVFHTAVALPVTVSSISAVNGKLVIDAKITDISDDYTLHIALYDNQNTLCDYLSIPNERRLKDVFAVYPDNDNAAYAKIFTWYSTDSIEPVSTCETVTIERSEQ